jgi:hypothetical protein
LRHLWIQETGMDLTVDVLCCDEWMTTGAPEIRLRLRKDGSGYYDRKEPGKVIHEKLVYKLEGALRIKLARARGWTEVTATVRVGPGKPDDRFGQRELVLSKDPYASAIEDRPSGELVMQSDAGAGLPGA